MKIAENSRITTTGEGVMKDPSKARKRKTAIGGTLAAAGLAAGGIAQVNASSASAATTLTASGLPSFEACESQGNGFVKANADKGIQVSCTCAQVGSTWTLTGYTPN